MRRPRATEWANAPPPGLRCIFRVALENGLRLPIHPFVGGVLSLDLGDLEALRATYNIGDPIPNPPPAIPTISSNQCPLSPRTPAKGPSVPAPAIVPLAALPHPREPSERSSTPPGPLESTDLPQEHPPMGDHSTTVILEPEGHGEVASAHPTIALSLGVQVSKLPLLTPEGPLASKKRMGSPV
ncbi:hypothetical protein LIER_19806 [Lithospermum erythrorhizon]|uniref:Uncharacterized protein n=1 Tax=Lithospermum erythrorhizon TaxID=34254 RepID=A0AAV3QND9_LITER